MLMKHTVEQTFIISGSRSKQSERGGALYDCISRNVFYSREILNILALYRSRPVLACNFSNELPGARISVLYFRGCHQKYIFFMHI